MCNTLFAQEKPIAPGTTLPFYGWTHRSFTSAAQDVIEALELEQTTDGMLWCGGQNGLWRFDGAQFTRYPGPLWSAAAAGTEVEVFVPATVACVPSVPKKRQTVSAVDMLSHPRAREKHK